MSFDPDTTTVGALVSERLGRAAVLEAHGVDYCCGGHRTLAELRDVDGLDLDGLVADLARADADSDEPPPDWAGLTPAELADHIETTHHPYVRAAVARLRDLATTVVSVHGVAHPELHEVEALFTAIAEDMGPHLAKEEQVLFPIVRQLADAEIAPELHCGSVANPIRVMQMEHDMVGDHLHQLRSVTGDYAVPADGCESYRALYAGLEEFEHDTLLHVHKENNVLFPAVLAREAELADR